MDTKKFLHGHFTSKSRRKRRIYKRNYERKQRDKHEKDVNKILNNQYLYSQLEELANYNKLVDKYGSIENMIRVKGLPEDDFYDTQKLIELGLYEYPNQRDIRKLLTKGRESPHKRLVKGLFFK